jgi:16S rRNA C967 or C1407 C5-methylase (RsmB/RsmF family)
MATVEKAPNLLLKLSRQLFKESAAVNQFNRQHQLAQHEQFINALLNPQPMPACILWCREKVEPLPWQVEECLEWQPGFVDRLAVNAKPGKHELHDRGYYYCLDFSSVFAANVLIKAGKRGERSPNLVVDVCAAPGGKSIFAWRALQPELLISNETIGKRTGMLIANLKRCQVKPAIVTKLDSKTLATTIPNSAEVVFVDAPCTGQSLLAKGQEAVGCFHPVNIKKNAKRQKRILANSAQLVAPQGYLAYMTCTYSIAENESVCEWFLKKFSTFAPIEISELDAYRSHLTTIPCYRMFPQSSLGAGAFTVLFQRQDQGVVKPMPGDFLEKYAIASL